MLVAVAFNDSKYFKPSACLTQLFSDEITFIKTTVTSSPASTIKPPVAEEFTTESVEKSVEIFSALFNELPQVKPVYRKIKDYCSKLFESVRVSIY